MTSVVPQLPEHSDQKRTRPQDPRSLRHFSYAWLADQEPTRAQAPSVTADTRKTVAYNFTAKEHNTNRGDQPWKSGRCKASLISLYIPQSPTPPPFSFQPHENN
jgi:hypothetical protein